MNHRWQLLMEGIQGKMSSQDGDMHKNKILVWIAPLSGLLPMTSRHPWTGTQNDPWVLSMLTSHYSQPLFMPLLQGTNILEDHFSSSFFHTALSLGDILLLISPGVGAGFQYKLWFLQISQFDFQSLVTIFFHFISVLPFQECDCWINYLVNYP